MTEQEIRELFKSKNVPLERDDVWSVQAARVVRHKALERLAAALNISYDAPQVLRNERDEAVILVTGRLGERSEWSIGEAAVNINYRVSGKQAAYVYAMAEKRAKDRVILKLAGLHGAYSEDEADDFKDAAPKPITQAPSVNQNKTSEQVKRQNDRYVDELTKVEVQKDAFGLPPLSEDDESKATYIKTCREILNNKNDAFEQKVAWWNSAEQKNQRRDFGLTQEEVDGLKNLLMSFAPQQKEAAE